MICDPLDNADKRRAYGGIQQCSAVAADEIRKLAESSSKQSKTISVVLKKIKSSIDKNTKSTDSVLSRFEAIDGGLKLVADWENGIMNAMAEQSTGSVQIM